MVRKIIKMNVFLKEAKDLIKSPLKPVLVVLGNESVDLDSAVSSVSLACHLNQFPKSQLLVKRTEKFTVAPVINSSRDDLPLKTEVVFWLKKHGIDIDNLLCRDEIDLKSVENFVLVDHHVSEFNKKVIAVLDHRPFDELSRLNSDCIVNIQEVGSNGTLVSDAIRKDLCSDAVSDDYKEVFKFCYGPIVLDTINFSPVADKVRPLDIEIGNYIENLLGIGNVEANRKLIYEELVEARADVSTLSPLQVLSKDLKIISNQAGTVKIALPGVIDVFKFIETEDAEDSIRQFAVRENTDVIFLMGMLAVGDSVTRFGGVINIKNQPLFNEVSLLFLMFFKYFKYFC